MGIVKLLPDLKPYMRLCHIKDLNIQTAAIDASIWMHKTNYAAHFIFNQISLLKQLKIEPILVFDGPYPAAKDAICQQRKRLREENKMTAAKLLEEGNKEEADKMMARNKERCCMVTEDVKQWCKIHKIKYIQSPFESDAQLAYLMKTKAADIIITEDSDLIVYGADKIMFEYKDGSGLFFEQTKVEEAWRIPFEIESFRAVAVAMGCDYLKAGIRNFGPVAALKLYQQLAPNFDFQKMMNLIVQQVDDDFEEKFFRAINTFKYQLVLDPNTSEIVPLCPYSEGTNSNDYLYAGNLTIAQGEFYDPGDEISDLTFGVLEPKQYYCRECPEIFKCYKEFLTHKKEKHLYKCTVCDTVEYFKNSTDLKAHMNSHDEPPVFICSPCGKGFWTSFDLWQHNKKVHVERKHCCNICEKAFKTTYALREHNISCHSYERPWLCDICGQGSKTRSALAHHKMTHREKSRFVCLVCGEVFKQEKYFLIHAAYHSEETPYTCKICGAGFKVQKVFWNHCIQVHASSYEFDQDSNASTENTPDGYNQLEFKNLKSGSEENQLVGQEQQHEEVRYKCRKGCGRSYASFESLTYHMSMCEYLVEKKCSICGKVFENDSYLKLHFESHSNDPSYTCITCGKSFRERKKLKYHIRYHHPKEGKRHEGESYPNSVEPEENQEYFRCRKGCGKSYKLRYQMLEHMKKCDYIVKRSCPICGKVFERKKYLDIHIKRHDAASLYKCFTCGQGFTKLGELSKHNEIIHPYKEVNGATAQITDGSLANELQSTKSVENEDLKDNMDLKDGTDDPRPYICKKGCGKAFKHSSKLGRHMLTCDFGVEKKCHVCGKVYKLKYALEKHVRGHDTAPVHTYTTSGQGFQKQSELTLHEGISHTYIVNKSLKKHNKATDFHPVQETVLVEQDLWESNQSEAGVKQTKPVEQLEDIVYLPRYKCKKGCGRTYKQIRSLIQHMRDCTYPEGKNCPICGKCFRDQIELTKHKRRSHPRKKVTSVIDSHPILQTVSTADIALVSSLSGASMKNQKIMEIEDENEREHKDRTDDGDVIANPGPYICSKGCGKAYDNSYWFKRHMLTCDFGKPLLENKCPICDRVFERKGSLDNHVKAHDKAHLHKCYTCGEGFKSRKDAKEHSENAHPNEEKPYKCQTCGEAFRRVESLTQHEKYHTGERSYKCVDCGEGFEYKGLLISHKILVHGVLKYSFKCSKGCGKEFSHKARLAKHLITCKGKIDLKNEKHVCIPCEKAFTTIYDLKRHISTTKMHQGQTENLVKCSICLKKFPLGEFPLHALNCTRKDNPIPRKYPCPRCGKMFQRRDTAEQHLPRCKAKTDQVDEDPGGEQ